MVEMHTFSIVARCPDTGMLGAASTTGRPFVGALLPLVRGGCGAASSQALANPYLAVKVLDVIASGEGCESAVNRVLDDDPGREKRQLAVVDHAGEGWAFTGQDNVPWAGHRVGAGYVVAGNMLTGPEVLDHMAAAYEETAGDELAERLLRALETVDRSGSGDVRGKKSSVLYVAGSEVYGYVDIRVDEHPRPIEELRRLFEIWKGTQRAYQELMATRKNPAGITDDDEVEKIRARLERY